MALLSMGFENLRCGNAVGLDILLVRYATVMCFPRFGSSQRTSEAELDAGRTNMPKQGRLLST